MAEKTDERVTDEKVVEIEMERLREFANHPFKVCADSQMIQLQDSIKKYGILNPLIVRPRPEGFYEIISGHRRKYAAEKLGYRSVPVKIIENDLDAQVENVILSGSRCRGIEKFGSDLDVVVDYKGNIREDDFFNILHEDGFAIAGIEVDINPITEDKTGSLAEYLESAEQYLKEKAQERKTERPSVREKIKQAKQNPWEKKKVNTEKLKNDER